MAQFPGKDPNTNVSVLPSRVKIFQQEIRDEGGQNDWDGCGKAFQDVICIFDDNCND